MQIPKFESPFPSRVGVPTLVGASLTLACLLLGACQSDSQRSPAGRTADPASSQVNAPSIVPEWSIHYRALCDEGVACAGQFGWIASSLKTLEVGPAPENRAHRESLSEDALFALAQAIETEWENSEDSERCEPEDSATRDAARIERLVDGQVITRCGSPAFLETIRPWVEATSPTPYPAPCWNLLAELRDLQETLLECRVDSDCAYVDPTFRPIEAGALEFIVTRTCDRVDPLWLANSALLVERGDAYATLKGRAQAECGTRFERPTCGMTEGFQALEAQSPACVAGRCMRR
jgi:hypothetical protein